jgi:ADP-heptose:LPS heptosyltransferase
MTSGPTAILSDKQLGDITILEPVVRLIFEQSGQPCAMHVKPAFRPLIDLMPHAAWGADVPGRREVVWTLSWSSRVALQALRMKARKRILLANKPRHLRWWYSWVFQEIRLEPPGAEYWGRYFWRIAGGGPLEAFEPARLALPPDDWRHPDLPGPAFLLLNPTAAWHSKFWTVPQWLELLKRLERRTGLPIVITGGGSPVELRHCADLSIGSHVLNLAGQTSLQQYLHALSRAAFVLCIDGAASHLAQAFGVPTLTLFGPTSEEKWHWPGPARRALAARHFTGERGGPVSGIPVAAVQDAAFQLWSAVEAAS